MGEGHGGGRRGGSVVYAMEGASPAAVRLYCAAAACNI